MNLILRRRPSGYKCTIGELYGNDGLLVCYTLEDVVRDVEGQPVMAWKVPGETAIPQGRYRITLTMSRRFQKVLPLVNMVEGFEGVRIHPGNKPEDTEGCILPGMSVTPDENSVLESRHAFGKVYKLIDDALMKGEDVFLEIRNHDRAPRPN